MTLLTFGADVELRSETKWTGGDVGRDSQGDVPLGRFERFLGLFVEFVAHPCPAKGGWTHRAPGTSPLLLPPTPNPDAFHLLLDRHKSQRPIHLLDGPTAQRRLGHVREPAHWIAGPCPVDGSRPRTGVEQLRNEFRRIFPKSTDGLHASRPARLPALQASRVCSMFVALEMIFDPRVFGWAFRSTGGLALEEMGSCFTLKSRLLKMGLPTTKEFGEPSTQLDFNEFTSGRWVGIWRWGPDKLPAQGVNKGGQYEEEKSESKPAQANS